MIHKYNNSNSSPSHFGSSSQSSVRKKKYVHAHRETPVAAHPLRPEWINEKPTQLEVIFFDLETTGGNPQNSDVIEIAAIKYSSGKEIARFSTLINPQRKIPKISVNITGITNEEVAAAPTMEEKIDEIIDFFGDSTVISHGVIGDFIFLKHYAKSLRNIELKNFYLCTHLVVANLLPQLPSKTLGGVAQYFGIDPDGAHRALADAVLTDKVFWKLYEICEKTGIHSIEELLQFQGDQETLSRLGSGILHRDFSKLPNSSALVYLLGKNREILYVVATPNARKTLSAKTNLIHEKEFNKLLVHAHDFRIERTSHFLRALLREKSELRKLNLPIDPRKYESRGAGYVQLFLPDELGAFLEENPDASGLKLPKSVLEQISISKDFNRLISDQELSDTLREEQETLARNLKQSLASNFNASEKASSAQFPRPYFPMRRARKISTSFKTKKFKLERGINDDSIVVSGHLQEGIGWCFGPFENHKEVAALLRDALTLNPIEDETLSVFVRLRNLETVVEHLFGKTAEKLVQLDNKLHSIKSYFKPSVREILKQQRAELETLTQLGIDFTSVHFPLTGLAIITNMEMKELDVAVVVNGLVRKELQLPVEQGEKISSSRFFSRLFSPYIDEINSPLNPAYFSEDMCNSIELFSFWIRNKKGEGEWLNFADLKDLFVLVS
jgi:DNA polymerase III epsilon subunit family exonuclease